ncbi:MAG: hypothetical protein OXC30_04305 [Alphaproteobacteria bacterium]|nr:hypothetical protein [Alphaproteobacteria bacterium]
MIALLILFLSFSTHIEASSVTKDLRCMVLCSPYNCAESAHFLWCMMHCTRSLYHNDLGRCAKSYFDMCANKKGSCQSVLRQELGSEFEEGIALFCDLTQQFYVAENEQSPSVKKELFSHALNDVPSLRQLSNYARKD